jgi:hypothetical protein
MARWQSLGPDSGKVVFGNGDSKMAKRGLFGSWSAGGETAWTGGELARKLEKKRSAPKGKSKGKSKKRDPFELNPFKGW